MKFFVDQNLPPDLARFLQSKGYPSKHVMEVQMDQSDDWNIWKYAADNEYVIVSKDEDFATMVFFDSSPVQVV